MNVAMHVRGVAQVLYMSRFPLMVAVTWLSPFPSSELNEDPDKVLAALLNPS